MSLARAGRSVVVLEADYFPRPHHGICLSRGAVTQLDHLGLSALLDDKSHRRTFVSERKWASDRFEAAEHDNIICDRGILDRDLLEAARLAGAEVRQGHRVVEHCQLKGAWSLAVAGPGQLSRTRARHVVRAGGRRSVAGRRMRHGPPTLALCGEWSAHSAAIRIAALPDAWVWLAPTARGTSMAIATVDARNAKVGSGKLRILHERLVRESGVLHEGTLLGEPIAIDASPYQTSEDEAGATTIGEADLGLDPLSSSGVQAAIQSAVACSLVLNTLLDPGGDHDAAREYWCGNRDRRIANHLRWTRQSYAEVQVRFPSSFWAERAGNGTTADAPREGPAPLPRPGEFIGLAPGVEFGPVACVVGTTVRRAAGVRGPMLDSPAAYLSDVPLAPLLECCAVARPAADLLGDWSARIGARNAALALSWAWQNGVVIARDLAAGRGRQSQFPVGD